MIWYHIDDSSGINDSRCNIFQVGYRWTHFTNRQVTLESTHLLLLHDFERVALQKVAAQKLNSSDLGITIRIPKGKPISNFHAEVFK